MNKNFKKVVKVRMLRLDISTEKLCRALNISEATHYRYLRHPELMTVGMLSSYADYLQFTDEEIKEAISC